MDDENDKIFDDIEKKIANELYSPNEPSMLASIRHEQLFEYDKWIKKLGKLDPVVLPEGCGVTPIPPYAASIARLLVRCHTTGVRVSAYLDCYDILGFFGEPYWEIYPYPYKKEDGSVTVDAMRYPMDDINDLSAGLSEAIQYLREEEVKR